MVDDEVQRATELRRVAARLRALAGQTSSPDARRALGDLAERFEEMAAQIDGGDGDGAAG